MALVQEVMDETGIVPTGITLHTEEVTRYGDTGKKYRCSSAYIEYDLPK